MSHPTAVFRILARKQGPGRRVLPLNTQKIYREVWDQVAIRDTGIGDSRWNFLVVKR